MWQMKRCLWIGMVFILGMPLALAAAEGGEEDFQFAWQLMSDRQEYDLAATKFAAFVAGHPTHAKAAEALSYMGGCYMQLKKFGAAAEAYARLLAEYPKAEAKLRLDAMLNGGHANIRLEHYDRAVEMYGALLQTYGEDRAAESALFWRGEAEARLGHKARKDGTKSEAWFAKAVQDFDDYSKRYPESKRCGAAVANAGFGCYDMGDYARAVERFQRLLKDYPTDSRAEDCQLYLGESLYRLKRYPEAREAYAAFLQQFPKSRLRTDARSGMAWCDHAQGKILEAAKGFAEAAQFAADNAGKAIQAHYDAGAAFREAGAFDEAIQELAQVAGVQGHALQGAALFRMGAFRLEQAKAVAREIAAARQADQRDQARALEAKRAALTQEAIQHLKKAIALPSLGGDAPEAGTFLGEAYLDVADYAAATQAFSEVASKWPKDARAPWALYHMALSLREQARALEAKDPKGAAEKTREAKEALQQVFTLHPTSRLRLQAAYAMADYQASLGEVDKSRAAHTWIVEQGVAWARAWRGADGKGDADLVARAEEFAVDSLFRLGESYYPKENPAKSSEYYNLVIQRYPKTRQAAMAMLRLGEFAEAARKYEEATRHYADILARGKDGAPYRNALYRCGVLQLVRGQAEKEAGARGKLLADALQTLAKFLADYPDDEYAPKALYYRAETLYALGKKQDAMQDYEAAAKAYAKQLADPAAGPQEELLDNVLFGLAWCRRECGRTSEAVQAFADLVSKFPASPYRPDALYILGLEAHKAKQFEEALTRIANLVREYPQSDPGVRALVLKGKILDDLKRHAEAAQVLEGFLKAHPKHEETPVALYSLSWAWWGLAKPKLDAARAAEEAYRAKAADGEEAAAPLKRDWETKLAAARQDEDKMADALKRMAQEYPNSNLLDTVFLRLGEVVYDRRQFDEALGYYQQALRAAKANPASTVADKAQYRIGWCLLRQSEAARLQAEAETDAAKRTAGLAIADQKNVEALKAFEFLATDYPKSEFSGEGYFRAAELRRQTGDFKGALAEYQRALGLTPTAAFAPAAAYGVGVCRLEMGQNREALEDFKTLLEAFPQGELVHEAQWGAGQACLNLKAYEDARGWFEKALAGEYAGEAAAKARFGLGLIALEQGQWEKAREEFLKVDAFHRAWKNWAALALLKASRAAVQLGQKDKARKDLEIVIKRFGFTPAAAEAKKALADLGD